MKLKIIAATVLKQAPDPPAELPEVEQQAVMAGQELEVIECRPTTANHYQVTLAEPLGGCVNWYVLTSDVQLLADDGAPVPAGENQVYEADDDTSANLGCGIFVIIIGLLCLVVPVVQFLAGTPEGATSRLRSLGWAGLLGGVPLTAIGAWYSIDTLIQRRAKLRSTFYALVEAQDGELTLLQYAKAADVSGKQAKAYLNERAKEFNATFEVDTKGGIIYRFR